MANRTGLWGHGSVRPKGAFTPAEVAERGLRDVSVWLVERIVDDGLGRVVAGAGEVVDWEVAVRYGVVAP
jgi:hypothetical protein